MESSAQGGPHQVITHALPHVRDYLIERVRDLAYIRKLANPANW
jgi:hypothetical protein